MIAILFNQLRGTSKVSDNPVSRLEKIGIEVSKNIVFRSTKALMLSAALLYGCQSNYLDKEGLTDYINDQNHGVSKTEKYNGVEVTVSFRPTDLLILQENGWNASIPIDKYEALQKKYIDHYYFNLNLSRNDREVLNIGDVGGGNFSSLVETLSFRMGEFTNITTSEDTISVADYIFSRTYGVGNSNDLLFVFPKEKVMDDKWLQFNLKEFGLGLGNIHFRFDLNDLNNIPKIKFNESTVK